MNPELLPGHFWEAGDGWHYLASQTNFVWLRGGCGRIPKSLKPKQLLSGIQAPREVAATRLRPVQLNSRSGIEISRKAQ
jgi:hypothetical protein